VFTLYPLLSGEGREHHGEIMREATKLIEAGKLMPALDRRRFSLDEVEQSHAAITGGGANGKIVVEIP
ncbi:zinc-binding dehydrogenase, partial [Bradyrhizobium sp.]|uniref:zinc-binding dehydrogenase n=1 Tax=Bradyrhizobium sp. TaxID=376 RepID=UPI00271F572B